ncbi:MFS transporter [Streptomyces sp. NPDC048623]|uniref:MFS transporter n=1 Tax=Streptomyces sp. NPDC048623 TaxID=3155761 RepID=UPI0034354BC8
MAVLGRRFGCLWAAYGVSALGSTLAFNALPLLAIRELHAGPAQVALLASVGAAVGAAVAVPLGPWVEFRRKRPVMITMDLLRCAAMLSVPAAYALGLLGFTQLLVVSVAAAAAGITFDAASGAFLKGLVPREDLLVANGRMESTMWTTTLVGPPLGGLLVGLLGPVATVLADAASYLLSALGIRAIGGQEPPPPRRESARGGVRGGVHGGVRPARVSPEDARREDAHREDARPEEATARPRGGDLAEGWRHILGDPVLRPLFFHTVLVNSLILATEPLLAVLLLDRLGYSPWQFGLVLALPCAGGLIGSRLARPLAARFGARRVLLVSGTLRTIWPVGLALVGPGVPGMALVMVLQFALILCIGVFNPLFATRRLERTPQRVAARTLSAWAVTRRAAVALLTAGSGLLAAGVGVRTALAVCGALLIATPLLLPWRESAAGAEREAAGPGGRSSSELPELPEPSEPSER